MIKAEVKTRRNGTVSANVGVAGNAEDITHEMCCIFYEVVSQLAKADVFADGVITDKVIDNVAKLTKAMLKARSETE